MSVHFAGFSADYNGTWTSVTPSNNCIGSLSNYTLIAVSPKSTAQLAAVSVGDTVRITFPAGFDLTTISGGSVDGTPIASSIVKGATTLSFETPVAIAKNATFTIILYDVTNHSAVGDYQLSMAIDNNTGTGIGNQNLYAAGASSEFTLISSPPAPTSEAASMISCTFFYANWNTATVANNYILDVATDSIFTNILAGYDSLVVGNDTTYKVTGLNPATTYYYRVSASNACGISGYSDFQAATTLSAPEPIIAASGPLTFCNGDSVILDAGNWEDYLWSTADTTRKITVFTSGSYFVTITDTNKCIATAPIVEIDVVTPKAEFGSDTIVCGGCVVLDAGNPGASYLWSTGEEYKTIKVCVSDTFWVYITDIDGCKGTDTIVVTIHPVPMVDLGPDISAPAGETVILDAGNFGSTFLWNTSDTTQTISVTTSGTYYVLVINDYDCYDVDSIKVEFTTGINEFANKMQNLRVSPNPANGNVNVGFTIQKASDVQLKIYNYTGAVVYAETLANQAGEINKNIDLSAMTPGIYFLQLAQGNQSQTVKIIRTK